MGFLLVAVGCIKRYVGFKFFGDFTRLDISASAALHFLKPFSMSLGSPPKKVHY